MTTDQTSRPMLTWDQLSIGAALRPLSYVIDADVVDAYRDAISDHDVATVDGRPAAPPTLLTFPMLQAVDNTWSPRPGMVHTTQEYEWSRPLLVGAELTVTGTVEDLYVKRDRRYLAIRTELSDRDGPVASGLSVFMYPDDTAEEAS